MHPSIPQKSENWLFAESAFFRNFNDVCFFFEDESKEEFYFCILKRWFPTLSISRIFPLKGKLDILAHSKLSRRDVGLNVYLLDRDFDHVLGKMEVGDNLVYLDRYCIENYLIDDAGVVELLVLADPKKKRTELLKLLSVKFWIQKICDEYAILYALFLLVQIRNIQGIENTARPLRTFSSKRSVILCSKASVTNYRRRISREAASQGIADLTEEEVLHHKKLFQKPDEFSGKHILEAIVDHACLRTGVKMSLPSDTRNLILARHSRMEGFEKVVKRIQVVLTNSGFKF